MKIPTHLLANSAIASVLYFAVNINPIFPFVFTFWGGFLIDIDHLFLFIVKYKTCRIKRWIEIGNRLGDKQQAELYIFHSPEVNLVLAISSFFSQYLFWIFIGGLVHIALDIISHYSYHKNFLFLRQWSIVYRLVNLKSSIRNIILI